MRIFDDIFGRQFFVVIYRQISLNIAVKYRLTEISKIFYNYREISSDFMTNSIELQMLSEDATS